MRGDRSAVRRGRKRKKQGEKNVWAEKGKKRFKEYFGKRGAKEEEVDKD